MTAAKSWCLVPIRKARLSIRAIGHFALVQMRSDLPELASNSRDKGTPEENKAVLQGSILLNTKKCLTKNLLVLKLEHAPKDYG